MDQFGQKFSMKLDGETDSVQTSMGSICSLILFAIVTVYAYLKVDVWLNKKDVDIMTSTQTDFFTDDYVFDNSQGLAFAFAFTAYDSETEYILDPSYGRITFSRYEWGEEENGDYFVNFDELPSHVCNKEELGIEGDDSLFYSFKEL